MHADELSFRTAMFVGGGRKRDALGFLCLASSRFVSAASAAYKMLNPEASNASTPTAVLLPCTHFVSGLLAGEVTDHDLRMSILGAGDGEGYARRRRLRFGLVHDVAAFPKIRVCAARPV